MDDEPPAVSVDMKRERKKKLPTTFQQPAGEEAFADKVAAANGITEVEDVMADRLQKLEQQKQAYKASLQRKMDTQLDEFRKKLSEDKTKVEMELAQSEAEEAVKHKRILDNLSNQQPLLSDAESSETVQQGLIQQHQDNLKRVAEVLAAEREIQRQGVRQRFAKKKALKLEMKKRQQKKMLDAVDEGFTDATTGASDVEEKQQRRREELSDLVSRSYKQWQTNTNKSQQMNPNKWNPHKPFIDAMMESELYQRLDHIEQMLKQHVAQTTAGARFCTPLVDTVEAEEKLVVIPEKDLTTEHLVALSFATFLVQYLQQKLPDVPKVSIKFASTVPTKHTLHSLHANLFHFDEAASTLYLHSNSADNIGTLSNVLVSGLAHVKCGDAAGDCNDNSPLYLADFYVMMQSCCEELYALCKDKGQLATFTT
eukprot:TRINITY_DN66677_c2_g10_i1.p1 TRINITY_DN66677_c2_g10~~TRINITY_DN66677_c2_g10_i1.p1  ORF type:complete len:426 (-),score=75.54 TRINITY_DN66677_c2_g10_i1:824-2101(-)